MKRKNSIKKLKKERKQKKDMKIKKQIILKVVHFSLICIAYFFFSISARFLS